MIFKPFYYFVHTFGLLFLLTWIKYVKNVSLNSDGQHFHQYQPNNNHLSPQIIEHKKNTTYAVGNSDPGLR
jgi:hypothetical protein